MLFPSLLLQQCLHCCWTSFIRSWWQVICWKEISKDRKLFAGFAHSLTESFTCALGLWNASIDCFYSDLKHDSSTGSHTPSELGKKKNMLLFFLQIGDVLHNEISICAPADIPQRLQFFRSAGGWFPTWTLSGVSTLSCYSLSISGAPSHSFNLHDVTSFFCSITSCLQMCWDIRSNLQHIHNAVSRNLHSEPSMSCLYMH